MRARKVRQPMRCPCCDELFSGEDGETMEQHAVESVMEAWLCSECETVYEDRDEAKECCR